MHSLIVKEENIEDVLICFKNKKSEDIVMDIILRNVDIDDFRVETAISNMICHNNDVLYRVSSQMIDDGAFATSINHCEETIDALSDHLMDQYLGDNPLDVLENILYTTCARKGLPLITDRHGIDDYPVLVSRISKQIAEEAAYAHDDAQYLINSSQTILFDVGGGCYHYGIGNILLIHDKPLENTNRLLKG